MKKNFLLTLSFLVVLAAVPVALLYAADPPAQYTLISGEIPFVSQAEEDGSFSGYINAFFQLGIGIGILLAVLMFVYNGVIYMTSDVVGKKAEAKSAFFNIIGGVVLILTAVLILQTINPDLVRFGLEKRLDAIQPQGGGGGTGINPPLPPPSAPDGELSYQPGIEAQRAHASPAFESFLQCMAGALPGNMGVISSISDSYLTDNIKTWEECARGECQHRAGSLHYGGTNCVGQSYAVDFGDEQAHYYIAEAARACDMGAFVAFEGNHVHVSIGGASGCGTD